MSARAEWKTMRVSAISYYKLVDLGNMLSMILGRKIAASDVIDFIMADYYQRAYPNLVALIQDPEKLQKVRREIGGQIERLERLWKERK